MNNALKYTIYMLRCLRTGNVSLGITTDLKKRFRRYSQNSGFERLAHVEFIHIEQFFDLRLAQMRLSELSRSWLDDQIPYLPVPWDD